MYVKGSGGYTVRAPVKKQYKDFLAPWILQKQIPIVWSTGFPDSWVCIFIYTCLLNIYYLFVKMIENVCAVCFKI